MDTAVENPKLSDAVPAPKKQQKLMLKGQVLIAS